MTSDWAVRNCAKIGTDTLYIEIAMECFPWAGLVVNARNLSELDARLKPSGIAGRLFSMDDSRKTTACPRACSVPTESEHALDSLHGACPLSENRYPLFRDMRYSEWA